LTAHLDGDITSDEYRNVKGRIVEKKLELGAKTKALTENHGKRFEPVIRFVKSLQEATLTASSTDITKKRDFLKKNGSNLTLATRRLRWEPRGPWKSVAKHGPFAHQHIAPASAGAMCAGETRPSFFNAEELGFEPRRLLRACRFSKPV